MNSELLPGQKENSISVIIPAYNAANYLKKSIESVLNQSLQPNEIIVVDDGSTDETGKLIENNFHNNVLYLRQNNKGESSARNTGIEHATSKWIALLDADDFWHKDKLKKQMQLLHEKPDLDWLSCNYFNEKTNAVAIGKTDKMCFFYDALELLSCNPLYVWSSVVILKRQNIINLGGFDPKFSTSGDTDFWIRYAYNYPKLGYSNEVLATYYDNPQSSIYTYSPKRIENVKNLILKHHKFSENISSDKRKYFLMTYAFRPIFGLLGEYQSKEIRRLIKDLSQENIRIPLVPLLLSYLPKKIVACIKSYLALKRNFLFHFCKRIVPSFR